MNFVKKRCDNGLRIIVAPMASTETVTLQVFVGTGSHYETSANNGISHFLEHMFFKGTKKHPKPLELDQKLDAIGASHNAFTSREETTYWIKASSKHFSLALEFVSDILQNALLREEEINRERGVILEEMKMFWDAPQKYIAYVYEELMYGDGPHGWDTIGTPQNIKRMKRRAFVEYWKSQYVASNTIVVIAGNVSENTALKHVEAAFRNLRTGKPKSEPKMAKIVSGPRVKVLERHTDQTHMMLGSVGFPLSHRSRLAAELLATILGGYMSSRLFSEIRERHGLAYAIKAGHESYKESGYFAAYAGVPHEKTHEVVERIVGELRKMRRSGVTREELSRAKENAKGSLALSLESTDEVAMFLGMQELLLGRIRKPDDISRRIDKITKEDINRTARLIFRPQRMYLAMIGPSRDEESYASLLKSI